MDYNNMNNYRNQMQESLIDAIKILYDGAITNEKIPKTLECIVSDDSKREQGIYKVKYMHNEFEVSCPLSEIYNCGDAVIVLVPDGDFSKTKIITGSADASGKSSSTDVEANPAAPATQELNKVRIGDIVYDIPEGGGTENAVKDVIVNGTSVVTNQIARLSAVSQQELINALSTKVNVTDFETLENEVDNLSDMIDEKASQQDLDDLSSVVDGKADASDVEAELAEKVDLSTYNTDMSLKADKTALDLKQDQLEFNTQEAATETLTRLKADDVVYNLGGGTEVVANPSETATDDLETIKIGDTVYDIPGGGSSTNYGKFTYDLLLENDPLPSYQNAGNGVNRSYTLSKSINDYDAVYVITCTDYNSRQTLEGCTDRLILKNNYYDSSHVLSGSYSDGRLMYVTFTDDTNVSTTAWGNAGYCPVLYKVYGVRFENKLINRSDIYSEEERIIGRWTDGKPLYQKTIKININSTSNAYAHNVNNVDNIFINHSATFFISSNGFVENYYSGGYNDSGEYVNGYNKIIQSVDNTAVRIKAQSNIITNLIAVVTLQYTKTTDSADSGVIPEDPMFISDPMIFSEEEQVVGSWTDGKPIYQKTVIVSSGSLSSGSMNVPTTGITNVEKCIDWSCRLHSNSENRDFPIPYDRILYSESIQCLVHVLADHTISCTLHTGDGSSYNNIGDICITFKYTKTTDSILSGPKKGKIVQRSDIYSEEERLIGRWTDGKPLYQKTINVGSITAGSDKRVSASLSIDKIIDISGNAHSSNYNQWVKINFPHQNIAAYIVTAVYIETSQEINIHTGTDFTLDECYITLQYTKTTDLPFSKQLIEDPQFVMMSDIYSEEEQVVGRWTDGKPLYQKTWIFDTSINFPNYAWTSIVNNVTIPFDNVIICNGFQEDQAAVEFDIWFDASSNSLKAKSLRTENETIKGFTLQYTKTTDAPGTGPTKGNLIYLPALYSEEEREVGVWTDGKPLYQKTISFDNTSSTDKIIDVSSLGIERLCYTACSLGTSGGIQIASDAYYMGAADYFNCYYNNANSQLHIRRGATWYSTNDGYVTIQYTKTADTPGSGTWTPGGQFAHNYSENEHIVGTWLDGKTLYERTYHLMHDGTNLYSYIGTEYDIGLVGHDLAFIFGAVGIRPQSGTNHYVDWTNTYGEIGIVMNEGTGRIHVSPKQYSYEDLWVTIRYTKSS